MSMIRASATRGALRASSRMSRGFSTSRVAFVIEDKNVSANKPTPANIPVMAPSQPLAVPPVVPTMAPTQPASKTVPLSKVPVTTPPPPPPKAKKSGSFTGFVFKTLLLATFLYGGTLFAATKNEKVLDFVIDNQLPFHEELLDLIEKGSIKDFKKKLEELQTKTKNFEFKLPSKDKIDELTHQLEDKSEEFINKTKLKLQGGSGTNGDEKTAAVTLTTPKITPVVNGGKPSSSPAIEHIPLVDISSSSSIDSSVKSTIKSFNDLILSIDVAKNPKNEKLITLINENVSKLSAKLTKLTQSFEVELQEKLKTSQTELLSSYTKKELALTENLLEQFTFEKSQLEIKLNKRLQQEIEATKETISQAAVNAVTLMRIEQTKNFETLINDKVNQERNGRLNNLKSINSRLESLENFAVELEGQLVSNHEKGLVQQSLNSLKNLIFNVKFNDEQPKLLSSYVEKLSESISKTDDELLKLAIEDLNQLLAKESTHSILDNSQLLARWEILAPELRSASLLPPNAGLLGHLASIFFSKLLLPVKGAKPNGKDIESVIGRVELLLSRGELDVAVEEAANLKGWSRKLANDWVVEGRKRLEVEFLINLIDAESKIL